MGIYYKRNSIFNHQRELIVVNAALLGRKSERNSNIELLRIVCMLFIIVHHFIVHGTSYVVANSPADIFKSPDWPFLFIEPFVLCGVNVFVLISGYFGINLKVSNISNLYVRCAVYGLLCYCLHLYVDGGTLGRYYLFHECVFSLTNTRWFIAAYLALLFLSPILNASLNHVKRQQFVYFLCLLTIINVYFGWYGGASVNPTGYNVMHFIYLYYIGRFLKMYDIKLGSKKAVLFYVSCALSSGVLSYLFADNSGKWYYLFAEKYNNPILIIESVALLLLFLNFRIKSPLINWLALSVISIYLIHENPYIGDNLLYPAFSRAFFTFDTFSLRFAFLIGSAVSLFCVCVVIDKVLSLIYLPVSRLMTFLGDKIVFFLKSRLLCKIRS